MFSWITLFGDCIGPMIEMYLAGFDQRFSWITLFGDTSLGTSSVPFLAFDPLFSWITLFGCFLAVTSFQLSFFVRLAFLSSHFTFRLAHSLASLIFIGAVFPVFHRTLTVVFG